MGVRRPSNRACMHQHAMHASASQANGPGMHAHGMALYDGSGRMAGRAGPCCYGTKAWRDVLYCVLYCAMAPRPGQMYTYTVAAVWLPLLCLCPSPPPCEPHILAVPPMPCRPGIRTAWPGPSDPCPRLCPPPRRAVLLPSLDEYLLLVATLDALLTSTEGTEVPAMVQGLKVRRRRSPAQGSTLLATSPATPMAKPCRQTVSGRAAAGGWGSIGMSAKAIIPPRPTDKVRRPPPPPPSCLRSWPACPHGLPACSSWSATC